MSKGRTVGSLQTTAMMACNCSDVSDGIEILCAILPMSGVPPGADPANYLLGVVFPDENTPKLIGTCAAVDIVVRSVRWPSTRYETRTVSVGGDATTLGTGDCMSRGTCREVDATVFVVGHFLFVRPNKAPQIRLTLKHTTLAPIQPRISASFQCIAVLNLFWV